jgi:hypothetical protein
MHLLTNKYIVFSRNCYAFKMIGRPHRITDVKIMPIARMAFACWAGDAPKIVV